MIDDPSAISFEDVRDFAFESAIDEAVIVRMENGAASKRRGQQRRMALMVMGKSSDTLREVRKSHPRIFKYLRDEIEEFRVHVKALLEVADAASLRLKIVDIQVSAERAPRSRRSSGKPAKGLRLIS
jgi:hypothetical protein